MLLVCHVLKTLSCNWTLVVSYECLCYLVILNKCVSRNCNSVADALAKKAKSNVGDQIWLHDLPTDIAPLVLHDVH